MNQSEPQQKLNNRLRAYFRIPVSQLYNNFVAAKKPICTGASDLAMIASCGALHTETLTEPQALQCGNALQAWSLVFPLGCSFRCGMVVNNGK